MWQGYQPHAPAVFTPQEILQVVADVKGGVVRKAKVRLGGIS